MMLRLALLLATAALAAPAEDIFPYRQDFPLFGPEGSYSQVEFSPDGRTLAAAQSERKEIWLWDLPNRKLLRRLEANAAGPAFAFAQGGRALAAMKSRVLTVWDTATGKKTLEAPGGSYTSPLAADAEGDLVAFMSGTNELTVFDLRTKSKRPPVMLEDPDNGGAGFSANALAFSPDGRRLAVASNYSVQVVGVEDRSVTVLPGRWLVPRAVAFSPDGRSLACAQAGAGAPSVRVWDLAARKETFAFPPAAACASAPELAYTHDGAWLLVGDSRFLSVHDAGSGRRLSWQDFGADGPGRVSVSRATDTFALSGRGLAVYRRLSEPEDAAERDKVYEAAMASKRGGKVAEAEGLLNLAIGAGRRPRYENALAALYLEDDRPGLAEEVFARMDREGLSAEVWHLQRGNALLGLGRHQEAREALQRATQDLAVKDQSRELLAKLDDFLKHYQDGVEAQASGRLAVAQREYEAALKARADPFAVAALSKVLASRRVRRERLTGKAVFYGGLAVLILAAAAVSWLVRRAQSRRGTLLEGIKAAAQAAPAAPGSASACALGPYLDAGGSLGDFEARELFKLLPAARLLELKGELSPEKRMGLAREYAQAGDLAAAAAYWDAEAVLAAGASPSAAEEVVTLHERAQKLDELLEKKLPAGGAGAAYSAFARVLLRRGLFEQALEVFSRKTPEEMTEDDQVSLFELHGRLGNFDQAALLLPRVCRIQPVTARPELYYEAAVLAHSRGSDKFALELLRLFQEAKSDYKDAASLYLRLKGPPPAP